MKKVWVVVANRAIARVLQAETPLGPLTPLEIIEHPEGRMHDRELVTDRPGRTFDRFGPHRHAADPDVEPGEHEAQRFAIMLVERLRQARATGRCDRLILVAPPKFLGRLRAHLDAPTQRAVVLEVDKDLAHLEPEQIRPHLPERLFSALE